MSFPGTMEYGKDGSQGHPTLAVGVHQEATVVLSTRNRVIIGETCHKLSGGRHVDTCQE